MGKKGAEDPEVEVTDYFMSIHYGICSGIDTFRRIIIKEKDAWTGSVTTQSTVSINKPELFGGEQKEGGAKGRVFFLPGGDTQVLANELATRLGRANGADCPGYRGIATAFFVGAASGGARNRNGFYWSSNVPYLPGTWIEGTRAPVGLEPSIALIGGTPPVPRAIYFIIDKSDSMNSVDGGDRSRLEIMKAAMDSVFDVISAAVDSGTVITAIGAASIGQVNQSAQHHDFDGAFPIDSGDVQDINDFVQGLNSTTPLNIDSDFRPGMNDAANFFDDVNEDTTERFLFVITDGVPTHWNGDSALTIATEAAATLAGMDGVQSYVININETDTTYSAMIDNTPDDGVPIIDGDDQGGLEQAVLRALYPDETGREANPAHIIYECLTNTDWGMGSPSTAIDVDAFTVAAYTLFAEEFGLSMIWTRQASIQKFIQEVLDHIQAVLFVDPATGLLTLKLIRNDYDPDELPLLTPSNATLSNFGRKLWGEIVNEIVVTWTNPENEQDETVTVQDLASIVTQGGIVSDGRNYYGVRSKDLATRLAQRDLRTSGAPLAACEAEVDRTLWAIRPASAVKVTWPEHGLNEVIMRVTNINYGKIGDPKIQLTLMEDVYGLDAGDYVAPPSTGWEDPSTEPEAVEFKQIFTLPLFFLSQSSSTVTNPVYPEVLAGVLASTSEEDTSTIELWDEVVQPDSSTVWTRLNVLNVIGHAELAADLDAEALSTLTSVDNFVGETDPTQGGFIVIGDGAETEVELALITDADTLDVTRGVLDTVPRAWPAGTPVWFVDSSVSIDDPTTRSAGETVSYKLLPRTSLGLLDLSLAPLESETLTERPWLPNRPANVTAHGDAWSNETDVIDAVIRPDPWIAVTWANRNRLTEETQVLAWTDASATPETGQTTKIEVLDVDGSTVLATHSGLTGTSFDVPNASFGTEAVAIVRTSAERTDADGDFESLQHFDHWVKLANIVTGVGAAGGVGTLSLHAGVVTSAVFTAAGSGTQSETGSQAASVFGALIGRQTGVNATAANANHPFNVEVYDHGGYADVATDGTALTVPSTGLYRMQANLAAAGANFANIRINNAFTTQGMGGNLSRPVAGPESNMATAIVSLTAADVARLLNNTSSSTTINNSFHSWFAIEAIDAATKYALVRKSANQALSANTNTTLTYDTEVADVGGWFPGSGSDFTVPSGVSRVRVSGSIATAAFVGQAFLQLRKGGAQTVGCPSKDRDHATSSTIKYVSVFGGPVNVTPGDTFSAIALLELATNVTTSTYTWFQIEEIPSSWLCTLVAQSSGQAFTGDGTGETTFATLLFDNDSTGGAYKDDSGMHSTSSNTGRLVVPAGMNWARCVAACRPTADVGSGATLRIRKNGAISDFGLAREDSDTTGTDYFNVATAWMSVTPGDYFEVQFATANSVTADTTATWASLECKA